MLASLDTSLAMKENCPQVILGLPHHMVKMTSRHLHQVLQG